MALTTDVTPRIHLTPIQVLQDEGRMKRLGASLCRGIFSYADADAAEKIVAECLKICGGSEETLAALLQSKIVFGSTPFRWVIANRPAHEPTNPKLKADPNLNLELEEDRDTVPPLFLRLLMVCDQAQKALEKEAQEEIMEILGLYYHSDVYAAVKHRLTLVPTHHLDNPETFFQGRGDGIVAAAEQSRDLQSSTKINFRIPKFFDRLLVDKQVWFEFLALGRNTVRFMATAKTPTSGNRLSLHFAIRINWRTGYLDRWIVCNVRLTLKNSFSVPDSSGRFSEEMGLCVDPGTVETEYELIKDETIEGLQWYANPKSGPCRTLSGTITLSTQNF
ncbi:hypothetical protein FA13DRAFT_1735649 [Coprinellus micaceus]|uniref:Uncharacterized protein n=1 Tax=Coprinellus micaceus TaxID=71717 RepID=A0A4Y7T3K1_COPMI|nr:hypothetical protein FA13DRAFT_1735649 [Coprinellus micaceus]